MLQNLRVDGINLLFPAVGSRVARSNHARNRARRFHIVRILRIDGVVFKRGAEFLAARFRYRQGACVAVFARFGGRVAFGRRSGFFFGGRCCLRRRSDLRRRGRFCRGGRRIFIAARAGGHGEQHRGAANGAQQTNAGFHVHVPFKNGIWHAAPPREIFGSDKMYHIRGIYARESRPRLAKLRKCLYNSRVISPRKSSSFYHKEKGTTVYEAL